MCGHLQDNVKSWWFLEPSCELQHLLPTQYGPTFGASEAATGLTESGSSPCKNVDAEWKESTECYFRSIASVLLLQQICLNSHKDITLEQV